jgi:tyrosinase
MYAPVSLTRCSQISSRGDMTDPQRKEYIDAVLCLQKKPPKAPKDKFPGALNRYDDFVATHESQAMQLHSEV